MPWNISGHYAETCNCDYLCPCPTTGLAKTTHGYCIFAMGFQVERGSFEEVNLDGRSFVVIGHTPGEHGRGELESRPLGRRWRERSPEATP